ncbi:MAG TPA: hypothetical protein DEB06_05815 [Phycisphaerales bacterium]|nr:hypothetical protein [Phycisphaerales bacterium]
MHLGAPEWLLGLWALPALALLGAWSLASGRAALRRFVESGLVARMAPGASVPRRAAKATLALLACALVLAALARPMWGRTEEKTTRSGRDVAFVIDVSRSMLAEDLAPNRLARAKLWVGDVMDALRGDRVAVVGFAGVASVKCPLTFDYGFARMALDELSPDSVPRGGTMIGDAVRRTLTEVFSDTEARYKDLILITDGEDHESFPVEAARLAGEQGVRIIAIGIGDETRGTTIRITDESGRTRELTHDGQPVLSRLDAKTLREMATASKDGVYYGVGTGNIELDKVYQELVRSAEQRESEGASGVRYEEQFQWFIAGALVLLLIDGLIRESRRATGEA